MSNKASLCIVCLAAILIGACSHRQAASGYSRDPYAAAKYLDQREAKCGA